MKCWAAVATVALASALEAQDPVASTLVGSVVANESGQPLPYSVIVLPDLGREQFTDESGGFTLHGLPPGPLLIRVRRLGYTPADITVPVRAGVTDTVRIALTRIVVRLTAIAVRAHPPCKKPGPPDPRTDTVLATVYGQLRLNAQQFQTLIDQHPFTYVMDIQYAHTELDGTRVTTDSVLEQYFSAQRWRYRPGKVVTRVDERRGLGGALQFNVAMLPDFAEPSFVRNHCFHNGGLIVDDQGDSLVRLDVVAADRLRVPDVDGSVYLDPRSFQIRRTTLWLSRVQNLPRGTVDLEVTTVFREILPSIPIFEHVWADQRFDPGVRGVAYLATHEYQSLAEFRFIGPPPGSHPKS